MLSASVSTKAAGKRRADAEGPAEPKRLCSGLSKAGLQTPAPSEPSSDPAQSQRSDTPSRREPHSSPLSQAHPPEDSPRDSRARASDWVHPADGIFKNTPIKTKSSSTVPHGLSQGGQRAREELRRKLNREMDWVEVSVSDWFKTCT